MIRFLILAILFMVDTRPFPRLCGTCVGMKGQNTKCTQCLGWADKSKCDKCKGFGQVWVACPTCKGSGTVTAG